MYKRFITSSPARLDTLKFRLEELSGSAVHTFEDFKVSGCAVRWMHPSGTRVCHLSQAKFSPAATLRGLAKAIPIVEDFCVGFEFSK